MVSSPSRYHALLGKAYQEALPPSDEAEPRIIAFQAVVLGTRGFFVIQNLKSEIENER